MSEKCICRRLTCSSTSPSGARGLRGCAQRDASRPSRPSRTHRSARRFAGADAIRLAELLLRAPAVERRTVHALAALFCLNAARLSTRLDAEGVFVPLAEQDRSRWDCARLAHGVQHLGESAGGEDWTRWHLEAGMALEHTTAPSVADTDWRTIVDYYDAPLTLAPGPVIAMNRALAVAELRGLDAGRAALVALQTDPKLAGYSFYWAARADVERRANHSAEAAGLYRRVSALAKSAAERR
jgi:predicted RNA polymerase sigma factor